LPREVQVRLHPISRPGKGTLYRAVIGEADTRGMRKGTYFRFRVRTPSDTLSVEFIPKLLARPGEHSIMITIPPPVVEEAGLVNASEVTLQLLGPTTAREAAKAAGKEKEFAESLKPKQSKRTVEKIRVGSPTKTKVSRLPVPEAPVKELPAKADVPKLPISETPVGEGSVKAPEESQVSPEPKIEDIVALPPASSVSLPQASPLFPTERVAEEEKAGSPAKPPITLAPKAPEAPARSAVVRKRAVEQHKMSDDPMKRVEDTLLSMKRKIIYVYLMPQVISGQLKTKQEMAQLLQRLMSET